jgi:signal recognition particle subunit SRP54
MDDVRTALLEADVHYEVAEGFVERVQQQALGTEVLAARPARAADDQDRARRAGPLLGGDEAVQDPDAGLGFGSAALMMSRPGRRS